MSATFNPITLNVVDNNGNTVGTVTIDQSVADSLYSYFVAKLQQDQTTLTNLLNAILADNSRVEAIANAIANDDTALDTLYQKIKEKLRDDIVIIRAYQPVVPTTTTTTTTAFNQLLATLANLLPLQLLASVFTAQKSTIESVLESVLPLLIIVPILEKIA